MHRYLLTLFLMLSLAVAGASRASAADDLPVTFSECVVSGGDVRTEGDEVTCRLVRSYDFRVYGTGQTECGEEIQLEVWGETRAGVVTYVLAPGKTVQLPEVGEEAMELPDGPLPCLDD